MNGDLGLPDSAWFVSDVTGIRNETKPPQKKTRQLEASIVLITRIFSSLSPNVSERKSEAALLKA